MLKQQGYKCLITSKYPDMQKRYSTYPGLRVHIRAFIQKQSHHVPLSLLYRDEERRDAVLSCLIYWCSLFQQECHHLPMSMLCREKERCDPTLIGCLGLDSLLKEGFHSEKIPFRGGLP